MDVRCRTPCGVTAALDILNRLSISDDTLWEEHEWSEKQNIDPLEPYDLEEEEAEACDPCLYDPTLFSPTASLPPSPLRGSFSSDRDKPLPPPPDHVAPLTPRLSHSPFSTPPSSPRASVLPHMQPLPRSRPPSTSINTSRVANTHATFPSISSTLSLLEERESEAAKRSGVIVTEIHHELELATRPASTESTVLAHPPIRKSSIDAFHVFPTSLDGSPKRKSRPTLNLATSTSPQLCTLADLATIPASPISITSPTRSVAHQPSMASLATSESSHFDLSEAFPCPPPTGTPASRWSIDSTEHLDGGRPITSPVCEKDFSQQSPPRVRKRDRLRSFISRARAGSLGKPSTSPVSETESSSTSPRDSGFTALPSQSVLSLGLSSRRTSHAVYEPQPISASTSTSTTTSTSSDSTASLVTPEDSQQDVSIADPFCPASPTFTPASYLPNVPDTLDGNVSDGPDCVALEPTLPPPSPDTPSPSFFLPAKQESNFPLLRLARKTIRRRKKKMVITCIPTETVEDPEDEGQARIAALRRERENRRRYDCVVNWCEAFGVVRRFERKDDGSIHVYWRDWEVADMVCRVSAQVYIKGVGRASLAWRYMN